MMGESLADVAGKGLTINIKGKDYELSVITIDDLAEFQKYIKSQRLKTFLEIAVELDSKTKAESISAIMAYQLTVEQMTEEMRTMEGTRYFLWASLKKKQPKIKLGEMGSLVDLDNFSDVATVIQGMGGKTIEKNAPGGKVKK